jgi:hypothetical protein
MQYRFLEVEFPIPGTNWALGFIGGFIIIYIAAYLALKRLPWFNRLKRLLERYLIKASNLTPEISPGAKEKHSGT